MKYYKREKAVINNKAVCNNNTQYVINRLSVRTPEDTIKIKIISASIKYKPLNI